MSGCPAIAVPRADHRPSRNLVVAAVPTAMPIAARFTALLRARHCGITPTLRSLSSSEIEAGIESLALDMAFGYGERSSRRPVALEVHPQYDERCFLLRQRVDEGSPECRIGAPISWRAAARQPLCMLSREMPTAPSSTPALPPPA